MDEIPIDDIKRTCRRRLKINIDSLPVYKSSSLTLTPTLFSFRGVNLHRVFSGGFFLGYGKPNVTDFLNDFIDEFKKLKKL